MLPLTARQRPERSVAHRAVSLRRSNPSDRTPIRVARPRPAPGARRRSGGRCTRSRRGAARIARCRPARTGPRRHGCPGSRAPETRRSGLAGSRHPRRPRCAARRGPRTRPPSTRGRSTPRHPQGCRDPQGRPSRPQVSPSKALATRTSPEHRAVQSAARNATWAWSGLTATAVTCASPGLATVTGPEPSRASKATSTPPSPARSRVGDAQARRGGERSPSNAGSAGGTSHPHSAIGSPIIREHDQPPVRGPHGEEGSPVVTRGRPRVLGNRSGIPRDRRTFRVEHQQLVRAQVVPVSRERRTPGVELGRHWRTVQDGDAGPVG